MQPKISYSWEWKALEIQVSTRPMLAPCWNWWWPRLTSERRGSARLFVWWWATLKVVRSGVGPKNEGTNMPRAPKSTFAFLVISKRLVEMCGFLRQTQVLLGLECRVSPGGAGLLSFRDICWGGFSGSFCCGGRWASLPECFSRKLSPLRFLHIPH